MQKGATKQSADEADKAIRKIVLDNPILTKSANIIRKIDKLKKQGDLPVKKSKGGGADMGAKKKKYNRGPQSRNKMQPPRSMTIDTTTSAYGDSAKGRPVPKFQDGGMCKGAGAAIKGTKFTGVF